MKKFLIAAVCLCVAGLAFGLWETGHGREVTVTTAPQRLTGFTANKVSVYVTGAETVYALVNTTTNVLATRIAAGTAVPIPSGAVFTFDADAHTSIDKLCMATTSGSSTVVIGMY